MTHLGGEGADHTLASADIKPTGEGPAIYAVSQLKPYLKPGLAEELGAPVGPPSECGSEVVCSCVPADTCACNTVSHHTGGTLCPGDCTCQSVCYCTATCYTCELTCPCQYDD